MSEPVPAASRRLAPLTLAALGVVYGDIGTSPLYTMKEVFAGAHHPVPVTPDNVLGILSLIFWALILVVSIKYVAFILRADNRGEGGIMALMALVQRRGGANAMNRRMLLLGLFGAALFYGDGVITPAISVLSAVEGLEVMTPIFKPWILPITLGVLFALFALQRQGTGRVGSLFGPITALWFLVLAGLGITNIVAAPQVLWALLPNHALTFFLTQPILAFLSLGAVFLAVTGAETLYADMGHFGRKPVQLAWLALVLPALTLNYFGQGALLLTRPDALAHPFFHMVPDWLLPPLVVLATAATVIASQAVISGAFSITHQAIQLGYVPRLFVQHTSSQERGQIYLPGINWALFIAVAALVLSFGSSGALAAAYGIAVTGTMIITTLLVYQVARQRWHWSRTTTLLALSAFMLIDIAFFAANITKIPDGGWFPLAFALLLFTLMTTWKRGRDLLRARRDSDTLPLREFVAGIESDTLPSIAGTAVYMTPHAEQVPHTLLHSLKHFKCLHEQVVILQVYFVDLPFVAMTERVRIERIGQRFYQVHLRFGFMDRPDLTGTLHLCASTEVHCNLMDTTFLFGRETLITRRNSEMPYWREKLFVALTRNAGSPASYFGLPPNRVVELGTQVVL